MFSEMETKPATRNGRKVTSWRIVERGQHSCGHVTTVTTPWHFDRAVAKVGDATGSAAAEVVEAFAQPCPDCRFRALGGPLMPGMFDR